jgi:hypothetical protein
LSQNITLSASDVSAMPNTIKYGSVLGSNGLTAYLKDQDGNSLGSYAPPKVTTTSNGIMESSDKVKLNGIESGAQVNIQSDWNVTDATSKAYIKNKPNIPSGVKLYSSTGSNTDGAMTQDISTRLLSGKVNNEDITNFENVEVIYDKTSTNSALNWGYTSGIKGGVVITGHSFSKYKKLRIYSNLASRRNSIYEVDLTYLDYDSQYSGSFCGLSGDLTDTVVASCEVDQSKNRIEFSHGYFKTSITLRNNNDAYIVFKIEGIY